MDGTSITKLEHTSNRLSSNNKSGCNGVYWHSKNNKWIAQITFKGKTKYLGSFDSLDAAVQARKQAEQLYRDFLNTHKGEQ